MHWIAVGGLGLGLALVVFGAWQVLLRPLGNAYSEQVDKKAELEKQLQTTKERAAQYEKFQAEAENVRRDLEFYSSRTDEALTSSEIYTIVSGLGNRLNLKDWSFEGKRATGSDLDQWRETVKFKADLDHVGHFLNACLNEKRLIVPNGMILKRLDDVDGLFTETVDATMDIVIYGGKGGKK